jgi:hypothetical protein
MVGMTVFDHIRARIDVGRVVIVCALLFMWEWLGPDFNFAYARNSLSGLLWFFSILIGSGLNIYFLLKFVFVLVTRNRRLATLFAGIGWVILYFVNMAIGTMVALGQMDQSDISKPADLLMRAGVVASIAIGLAFNYLLGSIHFSATRLRSRPWQTMRERTAIALA